MDSKKLNDWMQVIGIFAVVGSLIFVGLQMQQTQKIAIASQYQARTEAALNFYLTGIEADYLPVPVLRNRIGDEFTARDIGVALWLWTTWDNHYYQHQSGFLDEIAWQGVREDIQRFFAQCRIRFVYDWRRSALRTDFVDMINSLDDKCVE